MTKSLGSQNIHHEQSLAPTLTLTHGAPTQAHNTQFARGLFSGSPVAYYLYIPTQSVKTRSERVF